MSTFMLALPWAERVKNIQETGIMTTVLGMCVVFLVLLIICAVLALFGVFDKIAAKKNGSENIEGLTDINIPIPTQTDNNTETEIPAFDDKELVAVIIAAIAAQEQVSPDTLVIKGLRRATGWNQEAVYEQHLTI